MGDGMEAGASNSRERARYLEVLGAPIYGPYVDPHEPNRS